MRRPCEEYVRRIKEAYSARDIKLFERIAREAKRRCGGDIVDVLAAETALPDVAYSIARHAISTIMSSNGEQKIVHIYRLWMIQTTLVMGCASTKAFIEGTIKAADEAGWPWQRWILVAPLVEAVYRLCSGDVVDEVAELLGEEWAAAESFVVDKAARVEIDGVLVTILSSWP